MLDATTSDLYYDDSNYLVPRSPGLVPIRPRLHVDELEGLSSGPDSDVNGEVDINLPWAPSIEHVIGYARSNRSPEILPSRLDAVLVSLMDNGRHPEIAALAGTEALPADTSVDAFSEFSDDNNQVKLVLPGQSRGENEQGVNHPRTEQPDEVASQNRTLLHYTSVPSPYSPNDRFSPRHLGPIMLQGDHTSSPGSFQDQYELPPIQMSSPRWGTDGRVLPSISDQLEDFGRLEATSPVYSKPSPPSTIRQSSSSIETPFTPTISPYDVYRQDFPPSPNYSNASMEPVKVDYSIKAEAKRVRKRLTLPIIVQTTEGLVNVTACPDTGSDDNVISLELATQLGLPLKPVEAEDKIFSLANGTTISAAAETSLRYSFGSGVSSDTFECIAYVFQTLVVPAIMGATMLNETETFTKHRDRLVEELVPSMQCLRVNSIGKPKQSLTCMLDSFVGYAHADTGSDINLVSSKFATTKALGISFGIDEIQFADGSIGHTLGVISAPFSVGMTDPAKGFIPHGKTLGLDFYLLDNLSSDILVGQDTLEALNVFTQHAQAFVPRTPSLGQSDLNIIRHIGALESKMLRTLDSVRQLVKKVARKRGRPEELVAELNQSNGVEIQRENARREAIEKMDRQAGRDQDPSGTDAPSPDFYIMDSDAPWQTATTPSPSTATADIGLFVCTVPECKAPPFQTQYLLNSHAIIHSSARLHYCPITGCSRSQGGRGFKRKNEMIRHGLIHDSPGYLCPFCPDKDHKYPRPDNLQRHVRVHHADKSKDDPLLREAFAPPVGSARSRRRRCLAPGTFGL